MVEKNHTGPYLPRFTYSCSARQNPLCCCCEWAENAKEYLGTLLSLFLSVVWQWIQARRVMYWNTFYSSSCTLFIFMHCALKSYMYFLSFSEHRVCKLHFQLLAFGEVWRPDVMQLKLGQNTYTMWMRSVRFLQIRVIMHGSDLKGKKHPSDPMHAWLQITRAASQPARGRWRASPVKLTAIYIRLRARIIEHFLSGWSGHCARMCP